MDVTLGAHVAAGSVALASGYVALYTAKGERLHRRAGLLFVGAMVAMAAVGMLMAVTRDHRAPAVNVPAGLTVTYLVVTALTTVRPSTTTTRRLDRAATVVALGVGLVSLALGVETAATGVRRDGIPAFPYFMFGVVGMLAFAGDVRLMRAGGVHTVRGARRLARHLWRMSFALTIAALSFFLGQAKVIPKPIRIYPLLALPVLAVLGTMLWWLWRVRVRRRPVAARGYRTPRPVAVDA
jgi:hypothetical protein